MRMKSIYYYETMIGRIGIVSDNQYIYEITFNERDYPIKENELIKECYCQLDEYFQGKRFHFELPLYLYGTEFQKKVWRTLMMIPYGKTCSYLDIAVAIDNEKAVRAVGNANNKNKLPIVIPCHRVIGKNGKLVGYAGGLEKKEKLLELEREHGKS